MERGIPCQEAATVVITVVFSGTRTYGYFACVANAVPIHVNLIGIRRSGTVVTGIANAVHVSVCLVMIRRLGAVVAQVTESVGIPVCLVGIWNVNAVVEPVRHTIVIDILARRKGRAAQCVYDVSNTRPQAGSLACGLASSQSMASQ